MIPISLIKFLLVGAVNTAVGLSVIFAAKAIGAGDIEANAMGYGVGLTVSFIFNRRWTFRSHRKGASTIFRFLATFAIAYSANLGAVLALMKAGVEPHWSHVLGIVPYTLLFYLGSRWYVFPRS